MTCKDCKRRFECSYSGKSYKKSSDGDSWANWCNAFLTKHKSRSVEYDGYTAIQDGYNWHVLIYSYYGEFVLHASCTKRLSKRKLKKLIMKYKNNTPPPDFPRPWNISLEGR